MSPEWPTVFERVRADLQDHVDAGLGHLLTEDAVRFSTGRALVAAGVVPSRIAHEFHAPGVGPVDLVLDGPKPSAAVEFKFPRLPRELNAPLTQHYGSLLNDFYRLAAMDGVTDRWAVQVMGPWLRDHLLGGRQVRWCFDCGRTIDLAVGLPALLPATARKKIGSPEWGRQAVAARCEYSGFAGELLLVAYRVSAVSSAVPGAPPSTSSSSNISR